MLFQLLTRTATFAVTLAVASLVIFAFMWVLPGDPAQVALGIGATPEAVAELQSRFGTDQPLAQQ